MPAPRASHRIASLQYARTRGNCTLPVPRGVRADVLNDEQKRKYLTSLKKLMTYAQTKYPSDPSKMLSHPPKHS